MTLRRRRANANASAVVAGRSDAVHRLFGPDQLLEEGDHVRLAVQVDAVEYLGGVVMNADSAQNTNAHLAHAAHH